MENVSLALDEGWSPAGEGQRIEIVDNPNTWGSLRIVHVDFNREGTNFTTQFGRPGYAQVMNYQNNLSQVMSLKETAPADAICLEAVRLGNSGFIERGYAVVIGNQVYSVCVLNDNVAKPGYSWEVVGRSGDDLLIRHTPSLINFFLLAVLLPAMMTWLVLWLLAEFAIRFWKDNFGPGRKVIDEW